MTGRLLAFLTSVTLTYQTQKTANSTLALPCLQGSKTGRKCQKQDPTETVKVTLREVIHLMFLFQICSISISDTYLPKPNLPFLT